MSVMLAHTHVALASKEQLIILTTFSNEPIAQLIAIYTQRYPDVDIKLIHRRTESAIQLLNKSYMQDIDVVLSSSPYLFQQLHIRDQLETINHSNEIPQWLIPFVLPEKGKVISIGYSGAGVVWNREYLKANKLPVPAKFTDLTAFDYYGHITMTTPSRSGTTQMMLESIIAQYGWDKGWRTILNVGANLGTISSRSFAVSDYVAKGQFGIGPTIDSYALLLQKQYPYVSFTYDSDFTLMPTYVGIVRDSNNGNEAASFVEMIMSDATQQGMAKSNLAKQSINNPILYNTNLPTLKFDKVMKREKLINIIYDEAISERLPDFQDIWFSLSHYQQVVNDNSEIANQIKRQLFSAPISEQDVDELADLIDSQVNDATNTDGLEQALLVEFSYRIATEYEVRLERIARLLRTLEAETIR